jgi:hypothetical protein
MEKQETIKADTEILQPSEQTHTLTANTFRLGTYIPKYAGYYRIGPPTGYTSFTLSKKPNWFHRMFSKLLLGWEWVDNV